MSAGDPTFDVGGEQRIFVVDETIEGAWLYGCALFVCVIVAERNGNESDGKDFGI